MSRLRPGSARVEFFAVREEVVTLLAQGHTYASAYDILKKSKKITMCYGAFRGYAKGRRNVAAEKKTEAQEHKGAGEASQPVRSGGPKKTITAQAGAFSKGELLDPAALMSTE